MPESRSFGDPANAGAVAEWPQILRLMRAEAIARDDEWIHHQADLVETGMVEHWYGWSEGCSTCRGHLHACPEWGHAQSTALTWLARTAGLLS